ncbi:DUF4279 domain-containing protein [Fulvivirga sp.]|uniref:DUF4279 domain-containing protein n=1 Tax=Fulvivirga sp. TaxID=1931237 RepID=UPI0032EB720E
MWQKLTYSGNECNNYLYFSFDADFFDTAEVTKIMGLEPTSLMIKKEPVPKSTSWKYRIDAGNDIDLETHLERLIEIFEPKIDIINRLKNSLNLETRIQFVIDIDINPDSSTPYFGLNKKTIKFLNMTETEVDFDLYKADTIGLLDRINEK